MGKKADRVCKMLRERDKFFKNCNVGYFEYDSGEIEWTAYVGNKLTKFTTKSDVSPEDIAEIIVERFKSYI